MSAFVTQRFKTEKSIAMGQFNFDVPEAARTFIEQSLWKDAYICGIEGVPWQSTSEFDGKHFSVFRGIESSGKLFLTCPVPGSGYRTLSTCSLRPLEKPHLLPLELARGSCFRARVQSDAWQRAGLMLTDKFQELLLEGTQYFLDSAQRRHDPDSSSEAAIRAIEVLEQSLAELGETYAVQSISFRKQRQPQITTLFGASVTPPSATIAGSDGSSGEHAELFASTFNTVAVRMSWPEIETDAGRYDYDKTWNTVRWCQAKGLKIIGGPLIDFRERMMPNWLYLLEDDFEAFLDAATSFVERTVITFRGSVQIWNCASALNTPGPLHLDDEQVMRLAVCMLQTIRRLDPNVPTIMTFDQPFGEYLAKHREGISPLHFADALLRSGLGLAGIGLETNINYVASGTMPRSSVDYGQMIDRWATLGMPLLVQLSVPGASGLDARALAPSNILTSPGASDSADAEQLRIGGPLIRTLLAKHVVHGIIRNGWADSEPHVQSHSGLMDASGEPRSMLEYMTRVRREVLE